MNSSSNVPITQISILALFVIEGVFFLWVSLKFFKPEKKLFVIYLAFLSCFGFLFMHDLFYVVADVDDDIVLMSLCNIQLIQTDC